MTRDEQLEQEERWWRRRRVVRRVGFAALICALVVAVAYGLVTGAERDRRFDAMQEQITKSDGAAVEVAEQKQEQARTIRELCETGAIEQDDAGAAVCDEAARAADEDPQEAVASAKGDRGPEGRRGVPGPAGADGADGADGSAGADGVDGAPGDAGVAGSEGADGADGADGAPGSAGPDGLDGLDGAPGSAGSDGADGTNGKDGSTGAAGPSGPKGDTGPAGPKGDTGPAGPAGPAGSDGDDGTNGRGIASITCNADGQWVVAYSDDSTETVPGPCRVDEPTTAPETPSDGIPEEEA